MYTAEKKVQTRLTAHPACHSIVTVFPSQGGLDGRDVKLTTHLHLVRRRGVSEVILLHEVRHPRCAGSITKNFVYYTYSRTQLYFTK